MYIQSNFIKMKSSGLSVLFRIISSSSYREIDMKIYTPTPQKNEIENTSLIKHKFLARKRNVGTQNMLLYSTKKVKEISENHAT